MTKRVFALALALCLGLSLAGCGEKARPSSQPPTQPSSIEVRPSPSEDPASGEEGGEAPADLDALVREIVLTYGAEEDTLNGPARSPPTSACSSATPAGRAGKTSPPGSISPGSSAPP